MTYEQAFRSFLTQPLDCVIGQPLLRVRYRIPFWDMPDFRAETPNLSGLSAVILAFAEETLEIVWDSRAALRFRNAFHIEVRLLHQGNMGQESVNPEMLVEIEAGGTLPWSVALNEPLKSVNLYGFEESPQLIQFGFSSGTAVVTTGYAEERNLSIGDGDDLLVFSADNWQTLQKTLLAPWDMLWENA